MPEPLSRRALDAVENAVADVQEVMDSLRPWLKPARASKLDRALNIMDEWVCARRNEHGAPEVIDAD